MFAVLDQLQKVGLILNKDCGVEKKQAGTVGSTNSNFWISSDTINAPLVKKVLAQNTL